MFCHQTSLSGDGGQMMTTMEFVHSYLKRFVLSVLKIQTPKTRSCEMTIEMWGRSQIPHKLKFQLLSKKRKTSQFHF